MSLSLLFDNLMSSAGHQNVVYFPRTGHAVIAIMRDIASESDRERCVP